MRIVFCDCCTCYIKLYSVCPVCVPRNRFLGCRTWDTVITSSGWRWFSLLEIRNINITAICDRDLSLFIIICCRLNRVPCVPIFMKNRLYSGTIKKVLIACTVYSISIMISFKCICYTESRRRRVKCNLLISKFCKSGFVRSTEMNSCTR